MALLSSIKNILKRKILTGKAKEPSLDENAFAKDAKSPAIPEKTHNEHLGYQEFNVEKSKFSPPAPAAATAVMPLKRELPHGYGQDKIVLAIRDPWWLYAYWEVTSSTLDRVKERTKESLSGAKMVLRVYDVSFINFDGTNAHSFFDIEVNQAIGNWYIDTAKPGRSWCVDIGLRLANGEFIMLCRSNTVYSPLAGPSWITDEEWMIPEDMFARLYGMGFGFGKSSPIGKAWQERIKKQLFSGALASPGLASPTKKMPLERKFWLLVNTELIVYGATEPDAKVCVQGKEIKLRPDGTFSLRFFLPDGKQVIPVEAESGDGIDKRIITPVVNKETK